MTTTASEELFRQNAEAEDGMPVSAGARVAHVRLADGIGHTLDNNAIEEGLVGYSTTASDVINEALRGNQAAVRLLYTFAIMFVAAGLIALFIGVWQGQYIVAVVGAVTSSLFYPAIRLAMRIREQNLCIHLLKIPLSCPGTRVEAARILTEFTAATMNRSSRSGAKSSATPLVASELNSI